MQTSALLENSIPRGCIDTHTINMQIKTASCYSLLGDNDGFHRNLNA